MSISRKQQLLAIEAVARRFAATWENGDGSADVYLMVGGRRIALDVAGILKKRARPKRGVKSRLREDLVARRVLRDIESALRSHVPEDKTIVLTVSAPIKVPRKLVAALSDTILTCLKRKTKATEEKRIILGNRVSFCVLGNGSKWTARVIGFVLSGDPGASALANLMRSLQDGIAAKEKARGPTGAGDDRWLVLVDDYWIADVKTYRRACAHLSLPHHFKRILLIFDGGRVEQLAEI